MIFWHKPDPWISKQWHAYNERGMSLCERILIAGVGMPKRTRAAMPKSGRCGKCLSEWRYQSGISGGR